MTVSSILRQRVYPRHVAAYRGNFPSVRLFKVHKVVACVVLVLHYLGNRRIDLRDHDITCVGDRDLCGQILQKGERAREEYQNAAQKQDKAYPACPSGLARRGAVRADGSFVICIAGLTPESAPIIHGVTSPCIICAYMPALFIEHRAHGHHNTELAGLVGQAALHVYHIRRADRPVCRKLDG